jgi:hypothetical protein
MSPLSPLTWRRIIPAASIDRLYLEQLFEQFSSDALRVIRNAAAEMRVRQNWRAL